MDLKEIYQQARERFKGACRVCVRCDGRVCAGEMPGIGGIGTGSSFMANFDSLSRFKLNLCTIHDAANPDLSYDFFGRPLKMPILVAPVAGMAINMGGAMGEEEYLEGMVEGGKDAGSIGFTCDGPLPIIFDLGVEVLRKNQGWGVVTIKPREEKAFLEQVRRAEEAKVPVIATDIDSAGIIHMKRAGQPAGPWTVNAWKKVISQIKLPHLLPG